MSKITIKADIGVRAKVHVQEQETITRDVPELRNSAGDLVAAGHKEEFTTWATKSIVSFASEHRTFEIGPGARLIVEEQD